MKWIHHCIETRHTKKKWLGKAGWIENQNDIKHMLQNLTKGKYKKSIKVGEDLLVSDTKMFVVNIDWSIFNAVMWGKCSSQIIQVISFPSSENISLSFREKWLQQACLLSSLMVLVLTRDSWVLLRYFNLVKGKY